MGLSFKKDAVLVFLLLALTFAYFYHNSESNGNSRFGLIFVPRRLFPLVILLAVISVFQMFVIAASDVIVPDEPGSASPFNFGRRQVLYEDGPACVEESGANEQWTLERPNLIILLHSKRNSSKVYLCLYPFSNRNCYLDEGM